MRSNQETERRKRQMEANAWAWFAAYGFKGRVELIEACEDRVYFREFREIIVHDHAERERMGVLKLGNIYDRLQFEMTPQTLKRSDMVGHHKYCGMSARIGWRGLSRPSEQICSYGNGIFELDFDLFSASADLVGAFGHFFVEILGPRIRHPRGGRKKTNPFRIAKMLRKKRRIYPIEC